MCFRVAHNKTTGRGISVSQTLSKDLALLERIYDAANKKYFAGALQRPVITIMKTPQAYGHFTCYKPWSDGEKDYSEINIGAEALNRPIEETAATMIHEMVHQYCFENKIADTSRSGYYHNQRFKNEAEHRGIIIEKAQGIGWSKTSPSYDLKLWAQAALKDGIDKKRSAEAARPTSAKPSSTRKYICPNCGLSVRATKEVRVACITCDSELVNADANTVYGLSIFDSYRTCCEYLFPHKVGSKKGRGEHGYSQK
jgi:hypothetical protein